MFTFSQTKKNNLHSHDTHTHEEGGKQPTSTGGRRVVDKRFVLMWWTLDGCLPSQTLGLQGGAGQRTESIPHTATHQQRLKSRGPTIDWVVWKRGTPSLLPSVKHTEPHNWKGLWCSFSCERRLQTLNCDLWPQRRGEPKAGRAAGALISHPDYKLTLSISLFSSTAFSNRMFLLLVGTLNKKF